MPLSTGAEVTITVRSLRPGFYSLTPYPFDTDFLEVSVTGRYMLPVPVTGVLGQVMADSPEHTQKFTLVDTNAGAGA